MLKFDASARIHQDIASVFHIPLYIYLIHSIDILYFIGLFIRKKQKKPLIPYFLYTSPIFLLH